MFLNVRQAAQLTGLAMNTLNQMRYEGTGPKFQKRGRKVVYRVSDLQQFNRLSNAGKL